MKARIPKQHLEISDFFIIRECLNSFLLWNDYEKFGVPAGTKRYDDGLAQEILAQVKAGKIRIHNDHLRVIYNALMHQARISVFSSFPYADFSALKRFVTEEIRYLSAFDGTPPQYLQGTPPEGHS